MPIYTDPYYSHTNPFSCSCSCSCFSRKKKQRPYLPVVKSRPDNQNGILYVHIQEASELNIPITRSEEDWNFTCVIEINDEKRVQTTPSISHPNPFLNEPINSIFKWEQTFHIDILNATHMNFQLHTNNPDFPCYGGYINLKGANGSLNWSQKLEVVLEPCGILVVRVDTKDLKTVFRRSEGGRVFGKELEELVRFEGVEVPMVLTRLIKEIEERGLEEEGLYTLSSPWESTKLVRDALEIDPISTPLSKDAFPDTHSLTSLVKDFLRELREPLIPQNVQETLLDYPTSSKFLGEEEEGLKGFVKTMIAQLPVASKRCLEVVLDHLKKVIEAGNSVILQGRLSLIFGPLLICSTRPLDKPHPQRMFTTDVPMTSLDVQKAARTLQIILSVWD